VLEHGWHVFDWSSLIVGVFLIVGTFSTLGAFLTAGMCLAVVYFTSDDYWFYSLCLSRESKLVISLSTSGRFLRRHLQAFHAVARCTT
jgi:uncharacterized membrane protein YphA (DoxX/SURF4 family)